MSIDLKGKLYRDMSEQYRDAVSKEDFKKERRSQNRMAGDALTSDYFPDGAPIMDSDKDNIYSYDTSAFGAGSQKDPSVKRLSKADLKNLRNQDYSLEDIVDYADNIGETGVITDGGAAQRLLDRYRKKLSKNAPGDGDPIDEITDPGDFIYEPDPTPLPEIIDDRDDPPFTDIPSIIGVPGVDVGDFIPSPGTNIRQGNSLLQSIIQDNDVNSQVYGNGNTTTINQDNSATNYGGNQYNFARVAGYYS
tara:strand:+ start:484 stop:1230 length:747 start_codon:yes stop_codon:yes gene_type:complete